MQNIYSVEGDANCPPDEPGILRGHFSSDVGGHIYSVNGTVQLRSWVEYEADYALGRIDQ